MSQPHPGVGDDVITVWRRDGSPTRHAVDECDVLRNRWISDGAIQTCVAAVEELLGDPDRCACVDRRILAGFDHHRDHGTISDAARRSHLVRLDQQALQLRVANLARCETPTWAQIAAARLHKAISSQQRCSDPAGLETVLAAAAERAENADPTALMEQRAATALIGGGDYDAPYPICGLYREGFRAVEAIGRSGPSRLEMARRWANVALASGRDAAVEALIDTCWLHGTDGAAYAVAAADIFSRTVDSVIAHTHNHPLGYELLIIDIRSRRRGETPELAVGPLTGTVITEAVGRSGVAFIAGGTHAAVKIHPLRGAPAGAELGIERPDGYRDDHPGPRAGWWFGRIPDRAELGEVAELAWQLCVDAKGPDLNFGHTPESELARPLAASAAAVALCGS